MKTYGILFILLLAVSLSVTVFAQKKTISGSEEPIARTGILGGLSMVTIIKSNNFSSAPLYSFNAGAVLQLPLGRIIALQPQVLFSQKGYRAKELVC